MDLIHKLNKKLDKMFNGSVNAKEENGCVILTGSLNSWDDIVKAGYLAVNKKKYLGVINDIEYTKDWKCKIGKTWFAHPRTSSNGMLKTTEKAIDYFFRIDRDFDSIILAHTHKLGSYIQGDIYMYEQGCCCETEAMDYTDGLLTVPQQQGFIYVCQNDNGELIYDKTKLMLIPI